jgi:FlaA1/EpsC-like NDP-sugar epimerase
MMDAVSLDLPTRDVLAVVSHRDQRMIRFFEQIQEAAPLIGTAWIWVSDGNEIETGAPVLIVDLEA